jgi:hypothetical protein
MLKLPRYNGIVENHNTILIPWYYSIITIIHVSNLFPFFGLNNLQENVAHILTTYVQPILDILKRW